MQLSNIRSRILAGSVLALASVGAFAQATDPSAQVFTDLTTKVNSLTTLGYALLGVVLVATIGMGLAKKFATKAAG